jgi:Fe-S cluster assembly iron-binding protein IscA
MIKVTDKAISNMFSNIGSKITMYDEILRVVVNSKDSNEVIYEEEFVKAVRESDIESINWKIVEDRINLLVRNGLIVKTATYFAKV